MIMVGARGFAGGARNGLLCWSMGLKSRCRGRRPQVIAVACGGALAAILVAVPLASGPPALARPVSLAPAVFLSSESAGPDPLAHAPRFARVPLGESDALAVGERVFAIGSPLGLERTVTEGIVSTKTRPMQGELYLQTTAQINPGNSGGPLFNLRGEVVGVTNMKITFGEGLGFAIPIEAVKFFLEHRDAFAYDNDNPSNPYRYLEPPSRAQKRTDAR